MLLVSLLNLSRYAWLVTPGHNIMTPYKAMVCLDYVYGLQNIVLDMLQPSYLLADFKINWQNVKRMCRTQDLGTHPKGHDHRDHTKINRMYDGV